MNELFGLDRRHFLRTTAALTGAVALGTLTGCESAGSDSGAGASGAEFDGRTIESAAALPKPFAVPLPIPPVKRPSRSTADADYYDITAREARAEILPGLRTTIMGYDGIFPGPTIAARRGRKTVLRYRNELAVPTVVHLHGGHTPPESDGFPTDLVLPATGGAKFAAQAVGGTATTGTRDYTYPLDQRAATLWYHDHRMGFTGPQVWRGLAGFLLVTDDEEKALPLPDADRDIPLMITDRAFEKDGEFSYPAMDPRLISMAGVDADHMAGAAGDVILVNGAPWPELEVEAVRYRFRVLNASNAPRYELALDPVPGGSTSFTQIGSDQGLLEAPRRHTTLPIAPAERFDVIIDFGAYPVGTRVTLTNRAGKGGTAQIMRFVVARKAKDDSRIPAKLSTIETLPTKSAKTRPWMFRKGKVTSMGADTTGWVINGREFDPERIDAAPHLGEVEIWRLATDAYHPVHIHLSPFQVVSRNGGPPGAGDHGWKDTIDLSPKQYADVAIRFDDYAGRYLLHCHNLEHEDMAMMATFRTSQ
ncbi:copper oxidase [Streptomyces sp. 150FB]|uniref:multicopper oxidase family protein n=1 Tax=Streptomyces sp. 150FB TaxID=1576605 RepID=UPI0005892CFE|nr:multicopper oxidase family protein [Streptomyces sp. 150FB]KIF78196.1 copper oxidase [Streptomyces sp. 150FB]